MVLPQTPIPPENSRKETKISWIKLYQIVAQDATLIHFINMARINSVTKNINAVFANINLHLILFQAVQEALNRFRLSKGSILPVLCAVNLHS